MNYDLKQILSAVKAEIKRWPYDAAKYNDWWSCIANMCQQTDRKSTNPNYEFAHKENRELLMAVTDMMQRSRAIEQKGKFYELYKKALRFDAVERFDSFMLYLEIDREPEKRFYQPRRKVLKKFADALQMLEDDKLDELHISQPPRTGKLLADSTPVLTKDGWKTHGELRVGDILYRPDGKETMVLAVHPKQYTTHTVEFSDGSKIKCHANHEWKVCKHGVPGERVVETNYMIGKTETGGTEHKRGHRYNFSVPFKNPIIGEHKDLPVAPYIFGAWLGDGTSSKPWLTEPETDECIAFRAAEDGYPISKRYVHKTTGVLSIQFDNLRGGLQKMGFCHTKNNPEKYIPDIYLTASIEQRLELLAGLLDTDGTLVAKEKRYKFSTTSVPLKNTFIQLISTFGWRASVQEYEPCISSSGIHGRKKVYTIGFNPDIEIPTVVPRKHLTEFSKRRKTSITAIYESEPEQGNCITVEGDGMYLAGETLIPTHNSSLSIFFMLWVMGRDSERSNLYCSYSDTITAAFYNGTVEILNDSETYLYHDIFPTSELKKTNSKEEWLDLDRNKHYHSLTARSLYGTLNGACDANGYIIADDLISGIEEALNKDRLKSAWDKVDNNLLTRGKANTKLLFIGTRWSVADPIGVRREMLENDPKFAHIRYKFINIPALDENDESNFNYDYGVGFSTEYYQMRRASFERQNDLASWDAGYQQKPIERTGSLFEPDCMRYYNGVLPETPPDRVIMAVDPAYGAGDYVAAPVCYVYGHDVYVVDVVYSSELKRVTIPLICAMAEKHNVSAMLIEATKATQEFPKDVELFLMENGKKINIQTKPASTQSTKQDRVWSEAGTIMERFIFLQSGNRSKAYQKFMENVYAFKVIGKNVHDDAPDALAMASAMLFGGHSRKVEIFKRLF